MSTHRLLDFYRLMRRIRQFKNAAEIPSMATHKNAIEATSSIQQMSAENTYLATTPLNRKMTSSAFIAAHMTSIGLTMAEPTWGWVLRVRVEIQVDCSQALSWAHSLLSVMTQDINADPLHNGQSACVITLL